jgi:hypothetical protein
MKSMKSSFSTAIFLFIASAICGQGVTFENKKEGHDLLLNGPVNL